MIEHKTSLNLQNVTSRVFQEDDQVPEKGQKAFEASGCDNKKMLWATRNKCGDNIDVRQKPTRDGSEDKTDALIAAPYCEVLFHPKDLIDSNELRQKDVYVYLGVGTPQMVEGKNAKSDIGSAHKRVFEWENRIYIQNRQKPKIKIWDKTK